MGDSHSASGSEQERAAAEGRIGRVLRGKYTIDSILGAGGMAVVYAVTHRNRKRFALKMLHGELSRQPAMRERFLREGYVANTVGHPGAVSVLDDDVDDDGTAFLVMELLEGKSLEHIWEDAGHRMPANAVVNLAYQLLEVLAAAHAKGIVHRDIKPANVFLTDEGHVKVLDFGIARLREAADVGRTTNTGALYGTPAFMSPEQASGRFKEVDDQTDVWAVGATMFTLLTGRIVHQADNAHALLVAAATTDAPPLESIVPGIPLEVASVVDRALARSKSERWPNATAMRDALRTAHKTLFGGEITRRRPTSLAPPDAALLRTVDARSGDVSPLHSPVAETLAEEPVPSARVASAISPLAATAATAPTGMSAAISLGNPPSPAPMITTSTGPASRLRVGVGVASAVVLVSLGGWALLHARSQSITPAPDLSANAAMPPVSTPPSAVPPASTAAAPSSSSPAPVEGMPSGNGNGSATASPASAAPLAARPTVRPAVGPTPAPRASAKPASGAGDCFYFDPKLNRIVAKPGCR